MGRVAVGDPARDSLAFRGAAADGAVSPAGNPAQLLIGTTGKSEP